jgi:predicted nucleotidyltransferase
MEMTGRKIAESIHVAPSATLINLQELVNEKALKIRTAGKAYLFQLNEALPIIEEAIKPLFEKETQLKEKIFELIRNKIEASNIKEDILNISLFGSVQTKSDTAKSDMDFYIVVKTSQVKKAAEELFFTISDELSKKWETTFSPLVNDLSEFKKNAKKKGGVVQDILKSYRWVYGKRLEAFL